MNSFRIIAYLTRGPALRKRYPCRQRIEISKRNYSASVCPFPFVAVILARINASVSRIA